MNTQVIIGIVIGVVLLLALVVGTGIALQRRRRISLTQAPPTRAVDGRPEVDKSGGYQTGSGFSFTQGGTATLEPETPKPAAPKPPAPKAAPAAPEPSVADEAEKILETEADGAPSEPLVVEEAVEAAETQTAAPEVETPAVETPAAETPAAEAPAVEAPEVQTPAVEVPETPEVAAAPQLDEIAPTEGRLSRLRGRLARSQGAIGSSMLGLLGAGDLDEDSWEEIEDTLVMADLGTAATTAVIESLRAELASDKVRSADDARAALHRVLVEQLRPDLDRSVKALPHAGGPAVVLVVGVNGVGKTTTTGKLARVLVADGRRVLLGAADTFRAAAADQLQTWGERVGAGIVRGKEGADPASVAFDSVVAGIDDGVDVVLIDTAGRLHTKTGLMDELGKVKRVVEKKTPVDEVLLVLDATVGQNGLMQAKVFAEVVDLTGVVLTKLDGTAKGGIVFRIQDELGVPVKLVGLGEGADDLAPFDPAAFVDALL
ncbi:signal recognition particle-docking protein FtsY [Gordonia phosphorivorans]|uniref:Signal recognition particle receptor FtsY n=1 Tax=Gordonia phosphorivorans TaxID=1056982 RepID=A0ABV6HB12_9ACTN